MAETKADAPQPDMSQAYRIYVLIMLGMVSLFNYMDRMVMSVLIQPIKLELGLSDSQMGLVSGFAFAFFYAVLGIPLANMADRRHRVSLLSMAMIVWSAMTAACGLAANFFQILICRIGVGAGEAGCVPAAHSIIGDYFRKETRPLAVAVFQAGGGLGIMVGMFSAGAIADHFNWRWAFMLLGLPGIFVASLLWLTVKEPPRSGGQHGALPLGGAASLSNSLKTILGKRSYIHILIGYSLATFSLYGIGNWGATFFIRTHGMSLTQVGLWIGLFVGLGNILGVLLGGGLAFRLMKFDRRWELWVPAVAWGLSVPLYLAVFYVPSVEVAIGLLFVTTIVSHVGMAPGLASIQSIIAPQFRAMGVALVMFSSAIIGLGAGSFIVGLLSDYFAHNWGADSLKAALSVSTLVLFWSAAHFAVASMSFRDEIVS